MLDIFLTHNKKSLPFQLKYLNAQDGDSKTGHVYRMPYYQYQLEKLNLLLDGCKMSLIVTNRDTDIQAFDSNIWNDLHIITICTCCKTYIKKKLLM